MAWYVFALVDAIPSGKPGMGLSGALAVRHLGNAFVIVERRADVPPAEFGTLQRHHAVVQQLSNRVPAILPVRFGTLLETDALEEALNEREDDIDEAFGIVRGRVQFTWRREVRGAKREVGGGRSEVGGPKFEVRGSKEAAISGAEYLRRAAHASRPSPPPAWKTVRSKVAPLVAVERYQPGTASMPDSLYHLVDRDSAIRYSTIADALRHTNPSLMMTGPWPPFAFAPELL
ncbi:MAG TPA: GvpL/GvpF family gas vesicle protein [Vicinamibacterales bacterium]|nr:GvpL/GvpF family gas vesicle protein [Vicinamibacterales bacterium]